MAHGNKSEVRKARHKALKGKPLRDKDDAPLSYRTHATGRLNAAFKAVRQGK